MGHDYETIWAAVVTSVCIVLTSFRLHERTARRVDEGTKKVEFWSKWLNATIETYDPNDAVGIAEARHRARLLIKSAADKLDPPHRAHRPFSWKRLFIPSRPFKLFELFIRGLFYLMIALSALGTIRLFQLWIMYSKIASHRPNPGGLVILTIYCIIASMAFTAMAADNVLTYCK